jgi:hypothetical protein
MHNAINSKPLTRIDDIVVLELSSIEPEITVTLDRNSIGKDYKSGFEESD